MLVAALRFKYQPVNAHLIPIRRCNLSCRYCNEYDDHSPPGRHTRSLRRVDRLATLGTGIITISGGEPLLHPDLDAIIAHIRRRGAIATLITITCADAPTGTVAKGAGLHDRSPQDSSSATSPAVLASRVRLTVNSWLRRFGPATMR